MVLSKRWEMALLLSSGVVVVYCLRVNMSCAVQDMRDELDWSEYQKGLALSSFYWGYTLGQIPASRLAGIYGAKWIFGLSVLIPSILTLLVPVACRTSFALALVIRASLGFFEAASFPCIYRFFPLWVPTAEKTLLVSSISSGMYIGEIIGFSTSGYLTTTPKFHVGGLQFGGWDMVFYVFGLLGVLWFPFWAKWAYEYPEDHPSITQEELDLIRKGKQLHNYRRRTQGGGSAVDVADNPLHKQLYADEVGAAEGANAAEEPEAEVAVDGREVGLRSRSRGVSAERRGSRSYSLVSTDGPVAVAEPAETPVNDSAVLSGAVPWHIFFTHPVTLTLFVQAWVFGWVGYTLLSEMPSYLTDELGFDLSTAGLLCVLPYFMLFCTAIGSGRLFDWLSRERGWTVRDIRQTAERVALLGSGSCLVICGYITDVPTAFTFMIVAQALMGVILSGYNCAFLDITPNHSAMLNTVGNTIGSIAGIVGPITVGLLTPAYPGRLGWRLVFLLTFLQCIIAVVLWYFYQVSEVMPEIDDYGHQEQHKYQPVKTEHDDVHSSAREKSRSNVG